MLNGETQLLLREEYGFNRCLGWLGLSLVCLVEREGGIDVAGGLDKLTEDDMVISFRSSLFREANRCHPIRVSSSLNGGMGGLWEEGAIALRTASSLMAISGAIEFLVLQVEA